MIIKEIEYCLLQNHFQNPSPDCPTSYPTPSKTTISTMMKRATTAAEVWLRPLPCWSRRRAGRGWASPT